MPLELVHGDVARVALIRGGEESLVAGGEANLEREQDRQPAPSTRASTRSIAARAWARGIAYSISVKRTERVEA